MKKLKLFLLILFLIPITGCFKNDSMDNIQIYTTSYPIEYVTERLYKDHAEIKSIYPDGMQNGYVVKDKLLEDYSHSDLFIFNGLMEYYELDKNGAPVLNNSNLPTLVSEKKYVFKMLEYNRSLKIIDVASSISYNDNVNELWLDPINLLTVANNIKKGFNEYITSTYLIQEVNENYQTLKDELLKLDADYREVVNRSPYTTIVVSNDLFRYLRKYGLNVISLEENSSLYQKDITDAIELIENGNVKYIYAIEGEEINDTINNLLENYDVEIIYLETLNTLTEEERKNGEDYFSIMYKNLSNLKEELYK